MKVDHLEKAVLLLPFMQIASGHHQVADTLANELKHASFKYHCQKVDMLSYRFGSIEKVISSTYLMWIKRLPSFYHWLYEQIVYKQATYKNEPRYLFYETLFLPYFVRLIREKQPALLLFTHSLPSYMASVLKQNRQLSALTINVYTDFFVNDLWGIKGIDYHFVPSPTVKHDLINRGVPQSKIIVTGIPVDRVFTQNVKSDENERKLSIMVSGGHLGIGGMDTLISMLSSAREIHFHVLCGKNKPLYQSLVEKKIPHITPHRYITCRTQMNRLYDQVDGVLTKAGGVTLSECIMKRKPMFVYQALPGQEQMNAESLNKLGLIQKIDLRQSIETQILSFFHHSEKLNAFQTAMKAFHKQMEKRSIATIIDELINASEHVF